MSLGWNSNSVIHTGLDPGVLKQLKLRGDTLKVEESIVKQNLFREKYTLVAIANTGDTCP